MLTFTQNVRYQLTWLLRPQILFSPSVGTQKKLSYLRPVYQVAGRTAHTPHPDMQCWLSSCASKLLDLHTSANYAKATLEYGVGGRGGDVAGAQFFSGRVVRSQSGSRDSSRSVYNMENINAVQQDDQICMSAEAICVCACVRACACACECMLAGSPAGLPAGWCMRVDRYITWSTSMQFSRPAAWRTEKLSRAKRL